MKKNYLFPHCFQTVGWVLAVLSVIGFLVFRLFFPDLLFKMPARYFERIPILGDSESSGFFCMANSSILSIVIPTLTIGLVFIGFSKEKIEDECVKSLREQSLVWATYITALLFVIATLTIYGIAYTYVPYLVFFVFLLIFILRFKMELHRFNKGGER